VLLLLLLLLPLLPHQQDHWAEVGNGSSQVVLVVVVLLLLLPPLLPLLLLLLVLLLLPWGFGGGSQFIHGCHKHLAAALVQRVENNTRTPRITTIGLLGGDHLVVRHARPSL
jgi:hypothetical protein